MNKLILPFLNPKDFVANDRPRVYKNALTNPTQYANWDTVRHCLNNPWHYRCNLLNPEGRRLILNKKFEVWYEDQFPLKEELFTGVNEGLTFTIEQYGHYNAAVDNLLENIEDVFDCNADAHIFGNLKPNGKSFNAHWDLPPNFICQIEGETTWTVFKERCSTLIEMTDNPYAPDTVGHELTPDLRTVLQAGDVMYLSLIPYHKPNPGGRRLSMSIPCMYPLDVPSDRKQYELDI